VQQMNPALLSSDRMDWQTPENVLALVREFAGGQIALDPCTTVDNPTGALRWLTPVEDGLSALWHGQGLAFVNPPYGRELRSWARKMQGEGRFSSRAIIGLVPARTDTVWWQAHITSASAICFWRGRIRFRGAPASAPFPSALPYWGPNVRRFREVFGPYGWIP